MENETPIKKPTISHSELTEQAEDYPKAGFWVRVFATIIDGVLLIILSQLIYLIFGIEENPESVRVGLANILFALLIGFIPSILICVVPIVKFGQTPGKYLLKIKIVDPRDNENPSFIQAFLRENLFKFLSGLFIGIGYLMVAFRSDKRGLHDLLAKTVVIKL